MSKITREDLEKFYGKVICTQIVNVNDFYKDENEICDKKEDMVFDVYDGIAYCSDYKGKEYIMTFPKLEFIKNCKEMANNIREHLSLNDDDTITASNIMQCYSEFIEI